MSYPYRGITTENHAFGPVSGTHAYNSSYIHFATQTRSKPLQTLIETHFCPTQQTQCPTPLHKADTRPPGPPGEGVGQSAATVKVDGFSKTKNIDK
jgi:hypothetical protein